MARKRWVQLNETERVRPLPDGSYEYQQVQDVADSAKFRKDLRDVAKEGIAKATEAKGTPLRMFASAPETMHHEMLRQCGHDPEKQQRWFADHPELLVVPKNSAKVKGRRSISYPGQKRRS